ncbi:MAG: hypothetical protein F6K54_05395 [Okeania sp. SIO3B5]|nr:hypothetical protein [Okeania sp. SIO3B5]NEO52553.1 hypothetical protein [Okeania sp. SIO3B5]
MLIVDLLKKLFTHSNLMLGIQYKEFSQTKCVINLVNCLIVNAPASDNY